MASQLAIELTLAQPAECMFVTAVEDNTGASPTYIVSQLNMIPELLVFDASYDAMFLKGLRENGVPIKFSSWHTYQFSSAKGSTLQPLIQERSRSVKGLFTVQRLAQPSLNYDMGALLYDTSDVFNVGASTLQSYQYRIGGRYFPAQPVQCSLTPGSGFSNGGAEAYIELQKFLNILGDYRLSTTTNPLSWAMTPGITGGATHLPGAGDYTYSIGSYIESTGIPNLQLTTTIANCFAGVIPSSCFAAAIDLETSNGIEIAGLNAEEQSDIAITLTWKNPQRAAQLDQSTNIEAYTYYDAMIVLRENNVLELIQ